MILAKYPTKFRSKLFDIRSQHEGRCFIHALVGLPHQETLSLYGTHLEVLDDADKIRIGQIQELIDTINKDPNKNILIAGDFNALRKKDYAYTIQGKQAWDIIQQENLMRGIMVTPTDALALVEKIGFIDSFSKASFRRPKLTVWSGRVVDFIFLKNSWNLALQGSYLYYASASDHLPLILDIELKKTN